MNELRLLLLSLLIFPLSLFAQEVDGINYNFAGSSGDDNIPYKAAVTAKTSSKYTGSIVIPETVTYTSQSGWWWSITRTYKITAIAENAFLGCTSLTSVTIPAR